MKEQFDALLFEAIGENGKAIRRFLRVQSYAYDLAKAYVTARKDGWDDDYMVSRVLIRYGLSDSKSKEARQIRAIVFSIAGELLMPSHMERHDIQWFQEQFGMFGEPKPTPKNEDLHAYLEMREAYPWMRTQVSIAPDCVERSAIEQFEAMERTYAL